MKPTERTFDWSVVIPAFNEEDRLPRYLEEIRSFFETVPWTVEVIVADDGSVDGTPRLVTELARSWPALKLDSLPSNCGKGAAVRQGILGAQGQRILFTDADGATPIEEIHRLSRALDDGADIAIGSRALAGSDTHVETNLRRRLVGRAFHLMVSILGVRNIRDTQCGFKAFRAEVAHPLFEAITVDGFGFDVEAMLLAQRAGFRIDEIPVNWAHVDGSRISVLRDSPRMAREVVAVRLKMLAGRYKDWPPTVGLAPLQRKRGD
ncbi:MAG: glycosyltransferase family 2 protein [Gemmatimonadales bacterium]|nr:MAG: glycosyltransferase family 2 protein [Gemmatimonadales bacterium]